jgi:hypothetical protein
MDIGTVFKVKTKSIVLHPQTVPDSPARIMSVFLPDGDVMTSPIVKMTRMNKTVLSMERLITVLRNLVTSSVSLENVSITRKSVMDTWTVGLPMMSQAPYVSYKVTTRHRSPVHEKTALMDASSALEIRTSASAVRVTS